jgi:U3 small nucleolar RNA-associated protein 4
MQKDTIYAAGEEGVIRSWNKNTGEALPNYIELEKVRNRHTNQINDTIVWSLKVLSDHTLISGDSLGHVQIWDGYSGSLISSFSQHTADVVALAFNKKENIIFASGVDHKVVMLRLIENGSSGRKVWKYSYAHRAHTHDVKCLAIGTCNVYDSSRNNNGNNSNVQHYDKKKRKRKPGSENDGNSNNGTNTDVKYISKEIVFSGGVDTQICYYDVNKFEITRPRKIMPYPQQNNMFDICKEKRLLLSRFDTSIKIWKLKDKQVGASGSDEHVVLNNKNNLPEKEVLLYDIDVSETCSGMHTTCSAISSNGQYLAVGFQKGLRLYKLELKTNTIQTIKIPRPAAPKGGILCVKFSPCNKRFVISNDLGTIYIGHINGQDNVSFVTMQTPPHMLYNVATNGSDTNVQHRNSNKYRHVSPITMLSISIDSQWVAVGVLKTNSIYIYSMDNGQYHSTVPTSKYQFTSFSFIGNTVSGSSRAGRGSKSSKSSSGTIHLVVTCLHNFFYLYDVDEAKLSWWHNVNPIQSLPKQFINRREKIIGVINTPEEPDIVIMYTMNYFIKIDFTQALPSNKQDIIVYENRTNHYKRSNSKGGNSSKGANTVIKNFRITDRYRPILYVNFLNSPNELVIIERPWVKILQEFANPVKLKRYGAE